MFILLIYDKIIKLVPHFISNFGFGSPVFYLTNLVILFCKIVQCWSPCHNWTLTFTNECWRPRVMILLDDHCHVSYSNWSMKITMHFILHGINIQSEYDTWQSSSNKNVTRGSQYHLLTVNVQLWHGDQHCTILQNRMTKFVR